MKVSVIIPVYNAGKFLEQSVQSALNLEVVKEVVLVEDNSPDNSLQVCETMASIFPQVKLYRHQDGGNHGASVSRNLGVEKASYEYIAFLDADDYFLENRFDTEIEMLNKGVDFDGVYGAVGVDFQTVEQQKKFCEKFEVNFDVSKSYLTTIKEPVNPNDLFNHLSSSNGFKHVGYPHLNGITLNKESLKTKGVLFNDKLRLHQDTMFIHQNAFYLKLFPGKLTEPISRRVVHDENRITNLSIRRKYYTHTLLYAELYKWSKTENNYSANRKYFYKLQYNVFKSKSVFGKFGTYLKLVFKKGFFTEVEAQYFHFNLFSSIKTQRIYSGIYHRIYKLFSKSKA